MAPSPAQKQQKAGKHEALTMEQVKTLGEQLISSRAHINNLPRLLSLISPSVPLELALESLLTLQSFFLTLLPEIQSTPFGRKSLAPEEAGEGGKDPEAVFRAWLRYRFDEFVGSLIQVAVSPQSGDAIRDVVLDALMEFVKLGKAGKFQSAIYHRFIHTLVSAVSSIQSILDALATKFFNFVDVRYFTYTSLVKVIRDYELKHANAEASKQSADTSISRWDASIHNIYSILAHVPALECSNGDLCSELWCQTGLLSKEAAYTPSSGGLLMKDDHKKLKKVTSEVQMTKKLKSKFTKAWISFLKLPFPIDLYKQVLIALPQTVILHVANPVILCDFLTRSYDVGGVISVMALSSLFILITQHGVEYPKYYDKLYALLTPAVFMAKHRSRFLQLLDTSLKSSHIPAYVAAAFAKKLSRLALAVPPSGSLVIIAILHNLLRRHPSINFLVHQFNSEGGNMMSLDGTDESKGCPLESNGCLDMVNISGIDPYNVEECDLVKSDAMRSSLWEIDTMRHHYCPAVSRFVTSLENDLTVRSKTSEVTVADFSSGSYATIFKDEMKRRIKQVPLAFYKATPASLFSESDFTGWSFEGQSRSNVENAATCEVDRDHLTKRQKLECPDN